MTRQENDNTGLDDNQNRVRRARVSLEGLSVGDAFGEWFFAPQALTFFHTREMPPKPWPYTDDTAMAISVAEVLQQFGRIDQDALAQRFAKRYISEPNRGYGALAQEILRAISKGRPWSEASREPFAGEGSMGNGGAMRVGPVGGYFVDDLALAAKQARLSAEVTHAHTEGQAGAMAVAVAAARAYQMSKTSITCSGTEIIEAAIEFTPDGPTRDGLQEALKLGSGTSIQAAARILGNGSKVISEDTVPFAIWSAAKHLSSYEEAMWATVSGWGDMDTTCAIVGSIVVMFTGTEGIPEAWRRSRESLDLSFRGVESADD